MEALNKENVKLKNLLGLSYNPDIFDLLYEICHFLSEEGRMDGEFTMREVSLKTRTRINEDLEKDINDLHEMGFLSKQRKTTFTVIKHKWG